MSDEVIDPKLKEEILKAYETGWEDALVLAVKEAVEGSTGLEVRLVHRESMSQAPLTFKNDAYVSGIIGLNAGEIVGNICVMFGKATLFEIASTVYGRPVTEIDKPTLDCVGEITNLVHGLFKRRISEKGYFLKISLPNVILGQHQVVSLVATKYFRADYELNGHSMVASLTIDLGKAD